MTATFTSPVRTLAPTLATQVGVELRKSLSTRSGCAIAIAAVVLPALGVGWAAAADTVRSVTPALEQVALPTALVLLVVGVLSSAGEWSHRTVQTTLLLEPRRGRVLAAKALAAGVLGAVLSMAAAFASIRMLTTAVPWASWTGAPRALLVVVVAGTAFAVIGVGIGAAVADPAAALSGTYLLVFLVAPVAHALGLQVVADLDPVDAVTSLAQSPHWRTSVLVLVGWVVVSTVAGALLSRRRPAA